ncbi:Protein MAINTENANCE OF PSII UNDER HIGH LIGHT 1 [Linum grandiflorum]
MALACASSSQAIISSANFTASSNSFSRLRTRTRFQRNRQSLKLFTTRASSEADPDCNDEECAPEKEVGKVSMEWLAEEKTKVVGTFPPRTRGGRGWTGYVEKDTAGQTNIYSVEPAIYVAESAISSGTAGSSSSGAENTAAIAGGLALIALAAASSILIQVNKNPPQVQTVEYNGPSLNYYINKFKPPEVVQTAVPTETDSAPALLTDSSAPEESPPTEVQSELQPESSTTAEITDATPVEVQSQLQPETADEKTVS